MKYIYRGRYGNNMEQHSAHREIRLLPAMHLSIFVGLCGSLPNCIYWKPERHKYAKHSVAICFFALFSFSFLFCFFIVFFVFFLRKNADLGFRSLPRKKISKKKQERKRKNKYKAPWRIFLVFHFVFLLWFVFWFVYFLFFVCVFFIIFWFPLN